jgi:hypothetical protein
VADKRTISSQQVPTELTNALKKAQEPTPEERAEQRADVIDQLKASGHFDRGIIGRGPDDLSDEDIKDAVDELARRTVVSETTGKDVRDVKDQDFDKLIDDAEHRAAEDTLGIKLDDLSPLGRLIVESELRDPTGRGSTQFDDLLVDARDGTNTSGFFDRGKGTGTNTTPGTDPNDSPSDSSGSDSGGSGSGSDDGGAFDDGFGGPGDDGADGGGDDGGVPGDDVTGGVDFGQGDDGPPPDGDGGELDPDPTGGSDDGDPGGQPGASAGGGGDVGGGDVGGGDVGGGDVGGGGGGADDGSGETVDTVFQVNVGEEDVDPGSDTFGEGTDITFFRSDDGRWFDEAGHEVTDPDDTAALEEQYEEFQEAGGTDTAGTLEVSDTTFEEAVEQANQGEDEAPQGEDEPVPDGSGDPEPEPEPEPEPQGGEGGEEPEPEPEPEPDGSGDGAAGSVGFTPDDENVEPIEGLVGLPTRGIGRPGAGSGGGDTDPDENSDPAFGAGVSGPVGAVTDLKAKLLVDPPDPEFGSGGGPRPGGGAPPAPGSGAIDPNDDDVSFGSGSGPEQDPFDRVGSGPLDPFGGRDEDEADDADGADAASTIPLQSSVVSRADDARSEFEARFDDAPAFDTDDDTVDADP